MASRKKRFRISVQYEGRKERTVMPHEYTETEALRAEAYIRNNAPELEPKIERV